MRKYKIEVYPIDTTEGVYWGAKYPAIQGLVGGGNTAEEAIASLEMNADEFIEDMIEEGIPVPMEDYKEEAQDYSGRFSLRMSKILHSRAVKFAENQKISLNALVNEALMAYIAKMEIKVDTEKILEQHAMTVRRYESMISTYKVFEKSRTNNDAYGAGYTHIEAFNNKYIFGK